MLLVAGACALCACQDVSQTGGSAPPPPSATAGPTDTPVLPTATIVAATSTPAPPTATAAPPTATATGVTQTPGATDTPAAPTPTPTSTPTFTLTPEPPIGQFTCRLDPVSAIRINLALGTVPITGVGATVDVTCGAADAGSGAAPCTSHLVSFDPVNVFGIGFICATSSAGCADGLAACDGGVSLDVEVTQDHNIGTCDGGNDACIATCTAHCDAQGMLFFDSGCEGFCEGGPNDGGACTVDPDCPTAVCVGQDPVTHPQVCNCSCLATAGTASQPGGLLINLGARLEVEPQLPCGDGDATISLPPVCIPLTTESTTGVLLQANNSPTGKIGPVADTGAALSCADLAAGRTAGMQLVGNISVFDSTLGDLEIEIDWACQ